ncbi:hypothetical protein [Umezakia ovalisporum]
MSLMEPVTLDWGENLPHTLISQSQFPQQGGNFRQKLAPPHNN